MSTLLELPDAPTAVPVPSPASARPVRLTELAAGATARLTGTETSAECRTLLRVLGLTDASRLRLCKCGEPCIIQVRATRIGISSAVARQVYVVPDQPDAV